MHTRSGVVQSAGERGKCLLHVASSQHAQLSGRAEPQLLLCDPLWFSSVPCTSKSLVLLTNLPENGTLTTLRTRPYTARWSCRLYLEEVFADY